MTHSVTVTRDLATRTGEIARCTCGWERLAVGLGNSAHEHGRTHIRQATGEEPEMFAGRTVAASEAARLRRDESAAPHMTR